MSDIADTSADAEAKPFDLRTSLQNEIDRQMGSETGTETTETTEAPAPRDDGRDERGRFAKKDGGDDRTSDTAAGDNGKGDGKADAASDRSGAGNSPDLSARDAGQGAEGNTAVAPPPGWSVASKSAWAQLPEAVKADIAKREREVSDGFKQYQGLGDLKPIADAYARNGLSFKEAVNGYLQMDRALQTNFLGGIQAICQHYGVSPQQLGQALGGAQGQQAPNDPIAARLTPLEREIQTLKQEREAERRAAAEREQSSAAQTIEQFAADPAHIYFENVKATMGHLIQTGQATDLKDAYDKATWANPEIRALLIKQQQAAEAGANQQAQRQAAATQARQSARSLTGSPTPGGTSASSASKPRSIREIAEDAVRAQGVSL